MTMPLTRPILRTTDDTTNAVRGMAADATAALGGRRVTHEELIDALVQLGTQQRDALLNIIRANRTPGGA